MKPLPTHKCGLYLTHNAYRDVYQTIEQAVAEIDAQDRDAWVSEADRQLVLLTGELWELQWYPDTPIGFHRRIASTLEDVIP